ncbi:aldo/keto reductase [Ligilactobacillus faecis]|uniref:Aldo/keto reductase n=1 Tax=Ligilactobacillus faecis TaxID=762833 RepID=A0ABV4DMP6_9LACO
MEYTILNTGAKMPLEGIGTFMMAPDEAQNAVTSALNNGYELVDTANAYMNEKAVGRGIKASEKERNEIFLVSKLWPSVYEDETAIEQTLARLETDYLDLLILHQPVGNYLAGYRQMEKAYKEGKIKALGLSNFSKEQIQEILDNCEITPAVLQVEAHPYYPQTELRKFLQPLGIKIMAWYPLGHGDKQLINEEIFTKLAQKYGKSNAQIILRWHIQSGNIVIPGSTNPEHIKENADIYDFTLTEDEMAEIAKVDKNKRYYNLSQAEAEKRYTAMRPDFNEQK